MISSKQYRYFVLIALCVTCSLNAILYLNKVTNQIAFDRRSIETYRRELLERQLAVRTTGLPNVFGYPRLTYDYEITADEKAQKADEDINTNLNNVNFQQLLDRNAADFQQFADRRFIQNEENLNSANVSSRKLRSETNYDSEQDSSPDRIVNPHNYTYVINRPEVCKGGKSPVKLLIIVCTGLQRFENRQSIRETWGRYLRDYRSIRMLFLLGSGSNRRLQLKIKRESDTYKDIVQANFIDSYRNLSIKSVAALKWTIDFCKSAKYTFKSDDDIFVNIPNLVNSVEKQSNPSFIMGHLFVGAKPIQNMNSKWFTPKDIFPEKVYPPYVSGTGYIVTRAAAEKLFNASLYTRPFWLEDIYITGLCARKAEVKRIHHPEFSFKFRRPNGCAFVRAVTGHHVSVSDMYKIYAQLRDPNPQCKVKKYLLRP